MACSSLMDSSNSSPPLKVLMFPWLAHGHVSPFLQLSKRLSQNNFKIYFCSTRINLDSIKESINFNEFKSIELVELELPSSIHAELPPQYHTTKNLPPNLMPTLIQAFQTSSSNFYNIVTNVSPDLLIYDGFQPWAAQFASSQGIPSVHLSISGTTSMSFFHHLHTYRGFDTYPFPEIYLHGYEMMELMKQAQSMKMGDEADFLNGILKLSHDIVLVRTCAAIEDKYTSYLSELCNKRIVCVGPLFPTNNNIGKQESDIMKWLSTKNKRSTLYISIGSENYFSNDQIVEIAKALEFLTDVNFIWVLRFPIGSDDHIDEILPNGFLERVKDRGIIEGKWAPQVEILAHENVGGFMSHCGWNSVMESIYFGVPIVGVPMQSDQPANSRLVVELGVGVEVKRDETGRFNGENVAEAVNKVMVDESGQEIRSKVGELSEKVKKEEKRGFDEVAQQLSSICLK